MSELSVARSLRIPFHGVHTDHLPALSTTDQKAYALAGHILIGTGFVVGSASLCAAFAVSHVYLLGLTGAFLCGTTGIKFLKISSQPPLRNTSSFSSDSDIDTEVGNPGGTYSSFGSTSLQDVVTPRPFVPGQPVGMRNASANCWANSLLQFVRHIPSLYRIVQTDPELQPAFANFYQAYDEARATHRHAAPQANSQTIRQCLHARSGTISSQAWRQEDAHEGLMAMMYNYPPYYMRIQRAANDGRLEPNTVISIDPTDHKQRVLADLFEQTYAIRDYGPRSEFVYFQTRPDELFFHIKRFRPTLAGFTKNTDLLNIGPIFRLPDRRVDAENGGGDYLCDAFIEHRGSSASGGHYVAYVMDENGRWWLCNDQVITAVTEATVNSARKRAYILHFRAV